MNLSIQARAILAGAVAIAITAGCQQPAPDVVVTPGRDTVVHDRAPSTMVIHDQATPPVVVVQPPAKGSDTKTDTSTTTNNPPDGSSSSSTTTTKSSTTGG